MSGDASSSGGRRAVEESLASIRSARKRRVVKVGVVVALVVFLFVQAVSAVGMTTEEYQWDFFVSSLQDFFPITVYASWLPVIEGIPFVDVGQYWAYISGEGLIFDGDAAGKLASDPTRAFTGDSVGIFSVFGQAGTTLSIGLAGTVIGFPLALTFGVLGSERVTPFPFNFLFRGTMSAIRSIPALVWVLIYIPLAGITPVAATIAVATDTVGNLGRLFTDELEEVEDGPIEAMETTGAGKIQVIVFGMLSQVRNAFIAWTLYIFEVNVRIAVSLGIIGAGGLGYTLDVQRGLFHFTNMMATLLTIFLLIISVELFSQRVRARLRADEEIRSLRETIVGLPRRVAESLGR